jgi:putative endonuclease
LADRSRVARGRHGEDATARRYEAEGWTIVERNWRAGRSGEIDLIAKRNQMVAIVEVKARRTDAFGTGAEAVTATKQLRIRRLAAAWVAQAELGEWVDLRFDVAVVDGRGIVTVIEAAF